MITSSGANPPHVSFLLDQNRSFLIAMASLFEVGGHQRDFPFGVSRDQRNESAARCTWNCSLFWNQTERKVKISHRISVQVWREENDGWRLFYLRFHQPTMTTWILSMVRNHGRLHSTSHQARFTHHQDRWSRVETVLPTRWWFHLEMRSRTSSRRNEYHSSVHGRSIRSRWVRSSVCRPAWDTDECQRYFGSDLNSFAEIENHWPRQLLPMISSHWPCSRKATAIGESSWLDHAWECCRVSLEWTCGFCLNDARRINVMLKRKMTI